MAVGNDSTTFTAALASVTTDNLVVARFNSNGTVDTSFGTNGMVQIPVKIGTTAVEVDAAGIALQSNGSIIVGGNTTSGSTPLPPGSVDQFVVARVTSSGAIDTSFGGLGTGYNLVTAFKDPNSTPANSPINATMSGLTVAPDGNVDAVGNVFTTKGLGDIAVAQLIGSSGVLDTGFNGTGQNIYNLFTNAGGTASNDQANAIADQSNNQLVLVGLITEPVPVTVPVTPLHSFAMALRINPNGTVDTSFGGSNTGFILVPFNLGGNTETANAVTIDPSTGNIVATGDALVTPPTTPPATPPPQVFDATVFRLNTNGTLDTSFNGTGKQTVPLTVGGNSVSTFGETVAVLGDSSILMGGSATGAGFFGGFLAKLSPAGQLATQDPDYGPTGIVLLNSNDVTDYSGPARRQGRVPGQRGRFPNDWRGSWWSPAVSSYLKGKQPKKGAPTTTVCGDPFSTRRCSV